MGRLVQVSVLLAMVASVAACDAGGVLPPDPDSPGPGNSSSASGLSAATLCQPKAIGSVNTPPWVPPQNPMKGACTQQELASVVLCTVAKESAACQANVRDQCTQCALTPINAQAYGPLVFDQSKNVSLNIAGCVAGLSGDVSARGCGPISMAAMACEDSACAHCVSQAEYDSCRTAASSGICANYAAQAKPCQQYMTACQKGPTAADIAFNLASLFCL